MTLKLYKYHETTGEYLETVLAEADPEESKIQGKFVPLIPAFHTKVVPPTYGNNSIPVFKNADWEVVADYRHGYKMVSESFIIEDIVSLGDLPEGKYLVTDEMAEDIRQDSSWYTIEVGQVRKLTPDEHQAKIDKEEAERILELTLTASDVERALIKFKGWDFDDLKQYLKDEFHYSDLEIKSIGVELRANNFYRKNPLVDQIGAVLGFTSADMDYLFVHKVLPEKE